MANTNILIKRSTTSGRPGSLLAGEFAYSYSSNTLYIGSPSGTGVVNVGGQFYTSTIDAATAANTASTLVKRDANGTFAGRLTGIADKADQLTNARNFSISGHDITAAAVSFDGTGAVVLDASLNAVPGLTAGSYGSTTQIPVLDIGANGRILAVSTAGITTSFTVAADGGSSQTISGGDTLTLVGGAGITSTASATDTVTFDVDNTVVRSNTGITLQTINGGLAINGNLTVLGTQTTVATQSLNVADPLLYLASNNYTSDIVDIGFAANYFDGSTQRHTGFFRDAGQKEYYIFDNYTPEPDANNDINIADASFRKANVNANYFKGNVIATTANITSGQITVANVSAITVTGNTHLNGSVLANPALGYTFEGDDNTGLYNISGDLSFQRQGVQKFKITSIGPNSVAPHFFADGSLGSPSITNSTYPGGAGLYFPDSTSLGIKGIARVVNTSDSTSTTSGALIVSGGAGIAGNTYIGGTLNVTGVTSLGALSLTSALTVPNGGTGQTSFSTGQVLIGSGTNGLTQLANVSSINTTTAANVTVSNLTTDVYGRVTSYSTQAISGLTVGQGGTGVSSFTTNGITYGNGTGAIQVTAAAGTSDQSWSNQILTTTNAGVPVWTTALDGGQF